MCCVIIDHHTTHCIETFVNQSINRNKNKRVSKTPFERNNYKVLFIQISKALLAPLQENPRMHMHLREKSKFYKWPKHFSHRSSQQKSSLQNTPTKLELTRMSSERSLFV